MKRIISSKPALFMQLFLLVFTFTMSMVGFGYELFGSVEEEGAGLFAFVVFGGLFLLLLWASNRLVHVISFEDGKIIRRGVFGGFRKECPVSLIQKVVVKYVWREGHYIYLVDDSPRQFDSARKDSYICFRKTEKNLAFVHTFWSGVIEEHAFL